MPSRNSPILTRVLKAIKNNKADNGTTLCTIMNKVKADIGTNSSNGEEPRNLSFLVKRALLCGIQNGEIDYKYKKYHLTPSGCKMYRTSARRRRSSKRTRSRSKGRRGSKGRRRSRRRRSTNRRAAVEKLTSLGSVSSKTEDEDEWVDFPDREVQAARRVRSRRRTSRRSRSRSRSRRRLRRSRRRRRKQQDRYPESHDDTNDHSGTAEGKHLENF